MNKFPYCYFCQNSFSVSNYCFMCKFCPHGVANEQENIVWTVFDVRKEYRLVFHLSNNYFKLLDISNGPRSLLLFDYIPNVTPYNIDKKLPLLLTFQ